MRTDYSREELIAICERASVSEADWNDRDSYEAQFQLGECWALLRAGCAFEVHGLGSDPKPDKDTIWVTTRGRGFKWFEHHEPGEMDDPYLEVELHYLPSPARLERAAGKDWYGT